MANEIGGDNLFVSVLENALVVTRGRLLDSSLDVIVASLLFDADYKVDDRDIKGGDTEGKTAFDRGLPRLAGAR